jgi:uncharacterized delta-60 repeat protein
MFPNWLACLPGLFRAHSRRVRRAGGRQRLAVEALEDRTIPSVAGTLDPSFGMDGLVTTDFLLKRPSNDVGQSVAVQPDGKVVVLGSSVQSGTGQDFAVVRYLTDGTLDPSFGDGGKVTVAFSDLGDSGSSVVLQGDKILLAGASQQGGSTGRDFAVARINGDGSLDSTFGIGGTVTIDFGSSQDSASGMVLQGEKIVVVGTSNQAATGNGFAIARLNTDGSLDATFGTGGLNTVHFENSKGDTASAVAIQGDKIVMVGTSVQPYFRESASVFAVARLNNDGSLDTSFGSGGRATIQPGFSSASDGRSVVILGDKILLGGETIHQIALVQLLNDGEADPSFGSGGRMVFNYGPGLYDNEGWRIAMQGDKILAVGSTWIGDGQGMDFGVARFHANGSLDTSFGSGGKRTISFNAGSEYAWGVAVGQDGKIVVAGQARPDSSDFAVARLTANGSLDSSFSTDGREVTDIGLAADERVDGPQSVAVQPDGKIVVLGSTFVGPATNQDFAVARYNPDGTLDSTFGQDGRTTVDFGPSADIGWSVALAPNGKIVLAGYAQRSDGTSDFAVAVLNGDGSPDENFGPRGRRLVDLQSLDLGRSVAVANDKIIVVGSSAATSWDMAIARLNFDGTLDPSFNGTGTKLIDFGDTYDLGWGVAIQADGKIAVSGRIQQTGTSGDFLVVRLNPDGSFDPAFNGTGKATVHFGSNEEGFGIALQAEKLVVVGQTFQSGTGQDFAVARLNADGTLDSTFGTGGMTTIDFGSPSDTGLSLAVQGDKILAVGSSQQAGGSGWDFAVARLNADGTLDTTFNGTGKATVDFGSSSDFGRSVAIQGDNIVLAGQTSQAGTGSDFALARLFGRTKHLVQVDFRPGSGDTQVNLASQGIIAVAIPTTADFDAATVDAASVRFAGAAPVRYALEDVDGDGDLDMVLHFRTQDTNLREVYEQLLIDDINSDGVLDSTRQEALVSLNGSTNDGDLIEGSDTVDLFLSGKSLRELLEELASSGAI